MIQILVARFEEIIGRQLLILIARKVSFDSLLSAKSKGFQL